MVDVDVVFLEYSYQPNLISDQQVQSELLRLGFSCKRQHVDSGLEFWGQNHCLLLLRPRPELNIRCGITGLGLLVSPELIRGFQDIQIDPLTDYYLLTDPAQQLNVYLVDAANVRRTYQNPVLPEKSDPVFIKLCGAEWPRLTESTLGLIKQLASHSITDGQYEKITFSNKFMLFVSPVSDKPVKLVADTRDVFESTAKLTTRDVRLLNFNQCVDSDQQLESLTHKVVGYNCKAFGNIRSYSIENYAVSEELNLDVIFRERKNYLKITTDTLEFYNEQQK
jgi:hypothetical protein